MLIDLVNLSFLELPAAVALDAMLGEPSRLHPLVGFGNIAGKIDRFLFRDSSAGVFKQRLTGVFAVTLAVVPIVGCVWVAACAQPFITSVLVLYLSIGMRSLGEHGHAVQDALENGTLPAARDNVSRIVSRSTAHMQECDVARAAIESILENGSDAVFGAVFWFAVLGPVGAAMFRLSNTLDAMWGYKTPRYLHYGWAAARLDDVLGYVPARLVALSYAVCGSFFSSIRCWQKQAPLWYSPNAGPVMSAGAGALEVSVGGPAFYFGKEKERPVLGVGEQAKARDIGRALNLVRRALLLWTVVITSGLLIHAQTRWSFAERISTVRNTDSRMARSFDRN